MPRSPAEYVPQTIKTRRPFLFWLLCVALVLSILILIVGAPLAAANNDSRIALTIYRAFSPVCHQLPERSFFIAGHKLAVCARCLGLYSGFGLVLLLYPLVRPLRSSTLPPTKWLFLSAAPLSLDFSLTLFGIWENTHSSRLLTGMLLGGVTVFYVMPGIVELSTRGIRSLEKRVEPTFTMVSPETIAAAPSDYSQPERRI